MELHWEKNLLRFEKRNISKKKFLLTENLQIFTRKNKVDDISQARPKSIKARFIFDLQEFTTDASDEFLHVANFSINKDIVEQVF